MGWPDGTRLADSLFTSWNPGVAEEGVRVAVTVAGRIRVGVKSPGGVGIE